MKQQLADFIKEGTQLVETAHDEGRLIYSSYLFDLKNIEDKALKANVQKHWGAIIKEYKNNNYFDDLSYGYTDSSYFEHSVDIHFFEQFYKEFKDINGMRKMTYILKDGKKASEAILDILHHSKAIIDCQTTIGIVMYYALYRLMSETFADGEEKFNLLFSERESKLIFSKFNLISGTRDYCAHMNSVLAPLNPISYFLERCVFSGDLNQIETGMYVYFYNTQYYTEKYPDGDDQGAAAICMQTEPEIACYSFAMGKQPQTQDEIRQRYLTSYNKPTKKISEGTYPEKVTLEDIPGFEKEDIFFKFDIEKLEILFENIKSNKFPEYQEYLHNFFNVEKSMIEHLRLKFLEKEGRLNEILKPEDRKKIRLAVELRGFFAKTWKDCKKKTLDNEQRTDLKEIMQLGNSNCNN